MSKLWAFVIKIAIVLLMIAAIVILSISLNNVIKENRRIKSNYEAEVRKEYARQQTIDVRELKDYFAKEVEILKEHGIKPRNVENIIEVSYILRDSTRYRDTLVYVYDTIRKSKTADFCVVADCYSVDGQIFDDTLEIRSVEAYDELLIALYREKRKCLFEKQKVKAIAISGCSGDTLAILRNLKIEK